VAFSKKFENLPHGCDLSCLSQFLPRASTLRVTPAMEANLADHVWSLEELVGLLNIVERRIAAYHDASH
jgi:hypothetical protein